MNREMRRQLEKRQRSKGEFKTQFALNPGLRDEEKKAWFYKGFVRGSAECLKFIQEELIQIHGIGQKTVDRIMSGLHQRMMEARGNDNALGSADSGEVNEQRNELLV